MVSLRSFTLAADDSSVLAIFSAFTPSTDGTFRQNCQATITVSVPAGQQFSLDKLPSVGIQSSSLALSLML
jgi:hypothetical protein